MGCTLSGDGGRQTASDGAGRGAGAGAGSGGAGRSPRRRGGDGGGGGMVRPTPKWKSDSPMTESQLAFNRQNFWETTVTGNVHVWGAIKIAAEAAINGDYDLANTVLEAGGINAPHGSLHLCYDSTGALYEVPQFCYSTPENLVTDAEAAAPKRAAHQGPVSDIPITLRLSSTSTTTEQDIDLVVRSDVTIADLKARLHTELMEGKYDVTASSAPSTGSPSTKRRGEGNAWAGKGLEARRQRMFCQGRSLPNDFTVQDCGVSPNAFVQVFITP